MTHPKLTFDEVIEELRLLGTSDRLVGLYELGIEGCEMGESRHVVTVRGLGYRLQT